MPPGSYTAVEEGTKQGTGVGLLEVYDINQAANSQLANISTRGPVGTGDNVLIGGFIVGGGNAVSRVAVRAVGPSLSKFLFSPALSNPKLELHNSNGGIVASNDDWKATQERELTALGLALSDNRESALITTLPGGNYTAVVSVAVGDPGIGLVEIYNLE